MQARRRQDRRCLQKAGIFQMHLQVAMGVGVCVVRLWRWLIGQKGDPGKTADAQSCVLLELRT